MYQLLYVVLVSAPTPVACKPKSAITVTADPGGGAKSKWPKLPAISVLSADEKFAKVQSDKGAGYIKVDDLKKICGAQVLKDLALANAPEEPRPEPTMPLAVSKATELPASAPAADAPKPEPKVEPASAAEPPKPRPEPPPSPPPLPSETPGVTRVKRAAKNDGKTKIAVLDLKGSDSVPKDLRDSVGALIPESLDGLGPFKAISKQDIEQMLQLEAMRESVGCSDVACLAEIGGALGADYMVTGSLIRVDQTYMLQLQLLNIRTSRPEQRLTREYTGGPQGLFEEARVAAKMVVRDLLNARSGTLDLNVSEEGATVRIDGSIVGTSPMKPLALAGGLHTLTVEREGFVRQSRDISVNESQTTSAEVVMLPSEDFKKKYLREARLMRGLAWGFCALGLGAIGGGVALMVVDSNSAKAVQAQITTYNAQDTRPQSDRDALVQKQAQIDALDKLSIAMMAFGAVSIGVGVTLFASGQSPSKYDNGKLSTSVSGLQLQVGPARLGLLYHF
jgi:hypothetical protein